MCKKLLATFAVFLLFCALVFAAGQAADRDVSLPQPITGESACPVAECASGTCHGFADVPQPDGEHEMACPEASCSSVECHAWDTLGSRYHQASDASMNLWIFFPAMLVLALVLFIRRKETHE